MRILHIHDAGPLATHTTFLLKSMMLAVDGVQSVEAAGDALAANPYDLAILDLDEVPAETIDDLLQLRCAHPGLQFLVCGSGGSLTAVAAAMENGAHDFILRPMQPDELRIRIMRASTGGALGPPRRGERRDVLGPLFLDLVQGEVMLEGKALQLTPRERSVLQVLMRARGNVVSKDQIASRVFSLDDEADPKAIETYIHRLRRKTAHPALAIETVRGLGYRLRTYEDA
jgi:two-component system, OmpR family, response regulator TctD